MQVIAQTSTEQTLAETILSYIVTLEENIQTPIHVIKYRKDKVTPRVVAFDKQIHLLSWCREQGVSDAINGGFTLHHQDILLGEYWTKGRQHVSLPFTAPWDKIRGSVHISPEGTIRIGSRQDFPPRPIGDLLQGAPQLVRDGKSLMSMDIDPEGIAASSDQFDDDWTKDRFPRAAIGVCDEYIYCVATNGYVRPELISSNAGLNLVELADIMIRIGAKHALNLDGGKSTTLISGFRTINSPSGGVRDNYQEFPEGVPVASAIVFS